MACFRLGRSRNDLWVTLLGHRRVRVTLEKLTHDHGAKLAMAAATLPARNSVPVKFGPG